MELAGFCRNCLANWYQDAAAAKGLSLSKEQAREIIYGMPYETWKSKFQIEITAKPQALWLGRLSGQVHSVQSQVQVNQLRNWIFDPPDPLRMQRSFINERSR
jgi:hypothetical protein